MHLRLTGLLFVMSGIVPTVAHTDPVAEVINDEDGDACSASYPFEADKLKLVVRDGEKLLAATPVCSSYGETEAVVVKDAKGAYYILLRHGHGRGTNVRLEYLFIYKLGRDLIEHVRIPISQPSSSTGRWHYDYRVSKPKAGGLLVSLTLRLDSERESRSFPADKHRAIEVR